MRLGRSALYVRNGVPDARDKPSALARDWGLNSPVSSAIADLSEVIGDGKPLIVLAFGQFAFELCRRALGEHPQRALQHWTMAELGDEFRRRMAGEAGGGPLLVPLLHASIARGYYLDAHMRFCDAQAGSAANYFSYVGTGLGHWIRAPLEEFEARGAFM
jgi:hypothetical protein